MQRNWKESVGRFSVIRLALILVERRATGKQIAQGTMVMPFAKDAVAAANAKRRRAHSVQAKLAERRIVESESKFKLDTKYLKVSMTGERDAFVSFFSSSSISCPFSPPAAHLNCKWGEEINKEKKKTRMENKIFPLFLLLGVKEARSSGRKRKGYSCIRQVKRTHTHIQGDTH